MPLPFVKMQGAGNDYVFVDGFTTELPDDGAQLAVRVSHRHFGIGADGLVFLFPPDSSDEDVRMRMWNADGSEGRMCGTAARCIGFWMQRQGRIHAECRISTASGIVTAEVPVRTADDLHGCPVSVWMGVPAFPADHETILRIDDPGHEFCTVRLSEVNVGNSHAVIFTSNCDAVDVMDLGPAIERHPRFPDGINVEWVTVVSSHHVKIRVWERGSGETLSCGSGTCAAVAAAIRRGSISSDEPVLADLPGGQLTVEWKQRRADLPAELRLTGPVRLSFQGEWFD
ncbi:MAG: diaminopimelate epimerase [Planctomycetaceae bacterium]